MFRRLVLQRWILHRGKALYGGARTGVGQRVDDNISWLRNGSVVDIPAPIKQIPRWVRQKRLTERQKAFADTDLRRKRFEPTRWLPRSPGLRGHHRDVRRTALRLILVSNRVAIPTASGAHRAGGLEVVLAPTLKRYEGVWFGWSGNVVPRA